MRPRYRTGTGSACHFCRRPTGDRRDEWPFVLLTVDGRTVDCCDGCFERGQEAETYWDDAELDDWTETEKATAWGYG